MYTLTINDAEVQTLAWLTDRGYFPAELYDAMSLADGQPDEVDRDTERVWEIPEHAAWSLTDLREEDPDAYLSCLGGDLLAKVLELEEAIV